MLDKVSQLAERAAMSASRRQFLGQLGRGAMLVAASAGGLLALPAVSHGGRRAPRACDANSWATCQGAVEGAGCSTTEGFGVCQGPKPRGDRQSTVTTCACVTK